MALPHNLTEKTLARKSEVQDNFDYLESKTVAADFYAQDVATTSGLTFGYKAGKVRDDNAISTTAAGTVTLAPSVTNWVEVNPGTGAVSANSSGFTSGRIPLFQIITGLTGINSVSDVRTWASTGGGGATYTAGGGLALDGTEFSVPDGGITDAKIGNRTLDPALTSPASTGPLTSLLSWITGRIKAITGETNWYDAPDTTLAAAKAHQDAAAPHSGHLKADGTVALTANWDAGGYEIQNTGTPTTPGAVANKAYVDAKSDSHRTLLESWVATTANLGSLSGLLTIDGVPLSGGERVVVWKQTTPSQNGIYIAASGAWTRATDADSAAKLDKGASTLVLNGNTYQNYTFSQIETLATLGTDAVIFTRSYAVASGSVSATASLGGDVSVVSGVSGATLQARGLTGGAGISLTQNANDIVVAVDEPGLTLSNLGGALPATKGGTGLTSYIAGDLPYASATNTLSRLAANGTGTNKFLRCVSGVLSWAGITGADLPDPTSSAKGAVPPLGLGTPTDVLCRDLQWRSVAAAATVGSVAYAFSKTSHGFSTGNALIFNGTTWAKAKADDAATSGVLGIVSATPTANTFTLTMAGYISGLSGLTPGATYYLDATTAGTTVSTSPAGPNLSVALFTAISATEAIVSIQPPK